MKRPTAADVEAMAKRDARTTPPKAHIKVLLDNLEPEEDLRWCAAYADLEKKWGPLALLAVTDRRLIWQRYARAGKSKPDFYELDLDDVTTARDVAKKALLGLLTNHVLTIVGAQGTVRIPELPDTAVAAAAAAIVTAKIDRLSEAES